MAADHTIGRRPLSTAVCDASFLSGIREHERRHPVAFSSSDSRRHSSCSNTLRRFPSLTSVTELFQARPRTRLGPTSMRRRISGLFNNNVQHRRVSSDTAHIFRDTASHQLDAAPEILTPFRPDSSSFADDWSAIARDIECSSSSWCPSPSPSPAPAAVTRASFHQTSDPASAPMLSSPSPSSEVTPLSRRLRRSAARRGKRAVSLGPRATVSRASPQAKDDALSAVVDVTFETDVIDIVGSPNTSVTYSLPGAVLLTFPVVSQPTQGHIRLLHDVSVVLEGKAEYWDDFGRFSPFRVFTTTLPLIPANSPIAIPSVNPDSASSPFVTVRLDFDLRVPGWLPPSTRIAGRGSCAGVGYGVVATAVSSWCKPEVAAPRMPVGQLQKSSFSPYCEFTVRRHQMPTAILPEAPIESRSFIHTEEETFSYDINLGTAILPVEATFTVPDVIDIYGDTRALSVGIRIRIQPEAYNAYRRSRDVIRCGSDDTDPTVAYLMELGMIVEERHRFSSTPFSQYMGYFPVPAEQPTFSSQYSLLGPRFAPHEETPFFPNPSVRCRKDVLRPCLLSEEGYQRNFVFDEGGIGLSDRWRRINVVLLLPSRHGSDDYRPRPTSFTPFIHVSHALKTFCTLRTPGVVPESRPITFTTAVKFATDPATMPYSGPKNPPPFLRLYDEGGEPRLPDPLPLYTPAMAEAESTIEVDGALITPSDSDVRISRESSGSGRDDIQCRKPVDPDRRVSIDISSPGPSLREDVVSPSVNERTPKRTITPASSSRTRGVQLGSTHEDSREQ